MEFNFLFEIENKFSNLYVKDIKHRAQTTTIESYAPGAFKLASGARGENVPASRAHFFFFFILDNKNTCMCALNLIPSYSALRIYGYKSKKKRKIFTVNTFKRYRNNRTDLQTSVPEFRRLREKVRRKEKPKLKKARLRKKGK